MKLKPLYPVLIIFHLFLHTVALFASDYEVDICVYGGTSAGVIAAYTAKTLGHSVLLIEPGNHLGGLTSGGLGATDIGNKYAITGLSRDFYRRIGTYYNKFEQWTFEPHVAEKVFHDYINEADIHVLYEHRIVAADNQNGWVKEISLESDSTSESLPSVTVQANMFIDCSYEGDLMARAGISYTVGREANSQYGETINGVQLMQGHQFPDGIDPYIIPGDTASGLLPGINPEPLQPNGSGDKKVQAYNFRMCLCQEDTNKIPLEQPDNYDPITYELLARLLKQKPWQELRDGFIISTMPNGKTDWNNKGGFSTDFIGKNWDYPEASYEKRADIWQAHKQYMMGLFYFLANDNRVPAHIRIEMLTWGLCKDEFTDTNGWPHQLYVRESRRMIGQTVMTQHHCEGKQVAADGVGLAAYTMDSHNCQRIVKNGMVKNEGNVEVGVAGPYPISYGAILPKETECKNVLVPVCLSASHIAYGSIRMEPVFMVLGQSAATAASMAIKNSSSVQAIDVSELQKSLADNPYANGRTAEILIDDTNQENITLTGEWAVTDTSRWDVRKYGLTFLTDNNTDKGSKKVRYTPDIKQEGSYKVYLYWPKVYERASNIPVEIKFSKGIAKHIINMSETGNEWILLGTYSFKAGSESYVEMSNNDTDGVVLADAILFFPNFNHTAQ